MPVRSTVLIVDDDDDALGVTREVLERAGFDLVGARNGREALHVLTALGVLPSVIVLDVRMPVMDGRDVVRVLRSYSRLNTIPIILLSAYPADMDLARLCQAVVPKQDLHEKLVPTVRSFARGTYPPIEE